MGYTKNPKKMPKAANSLQEECVRVPKVYDWVTDTMSVSKTIHFTDEQKRKIEKTMEDPKCRPLRIVCETPDVPPLFSLKRRHDYDDGWGKDFLCEQVGEKRDVTVPLNGEYVDAQVVDLLFTADITVKVVDRNGYVVAAMQCNSSVFESFVLCYPDGTELMCNITKVLCRIPSGTVLLNGPCPSWFTLEVSFCVDIQVEAEVKMELLAKFCSPRETIEAPEMSEIECPTPEFPPQCPDIFPQPGCDCTASGKGRGSTGDECSDSGDTSLVVDICPNCTISNSDMKFAFKDSEGEEGWKDFNFMATDFDADSLECEPCDGGMKFMISGSGETEDGDEYDFSLAIVDSKHGDQFQIELEESGHHHHHYHRGHHHHHRRFDSGIVDVTDGELNVEECVNFDEIKYKRPQHKMAW